MRTAIAFLLLASVANAAKLGSYVAQSFVDNMAGMRVQVLNDQGLTIGTDESPAVNALGAQRGAYVVATLTITGEPQVVTAQWLDTGTGYLAAQRKFYIVSDATVDEATAIAQTVWGLEGSTVAVVGTTGQLLNDASAQTKEATLRGVVWDAPKANHVGADSMGLSQGNTETQATTAATQSTTAATQATTAAAQTTEEAQRKATWDAPKASYVVAGSMGLSQGDTETQATTAATQSTTAATQATAAASQTTEAAQRAATWNAAKANHVEVGSMGLSQGETETQATAAASQTTENAQRDATWGALYSNYAAVNTFGKALGDWIVDQRLDSVLARVDTNTQNISVAGARLHSSTVATIVDATTYTLADGGPTDGIYADKTAVFRSATSLDVSSVPSTGWTAATNTLNVGRAPGYTVAVGDAVEIYAIGEAIYDARDLQLAQELRELSRRADGRFEAIYPMYIAKGETITLGLDAKTGPALPPGAVILTVSDPVWLTPVTGLSAIKRGVGTDGRYANIEVTAAGDVQSGARGYVQVNVSPSTNPSSTVRLLCEVIVMQEP